MPVCSAVCEECEQQIAVAKEIGEQNQLHLVEKFENSFDWL